MEWNEARQEGESLIWKIRTIKERNGGGGGQNKDRGSWDGKKPPPFSISHLTAIKELKYKQQRDDDSK